MLDAGFWTSDFRQRLEMKESTSLLVEWKYYDQGLAGWYIVKGNRFLARRGVIHRELPIPCTTRF